MRLFRSLSHSIRRSVRLKLLTLTLLPVALVLPASLAGLTAWGASFTYEQLYIKVNTDLAVAHDLFQRIQKDHLDRLARLGNSYVFREALRNGDRQAVQRLIEDERGSASFSFLRVVPTGTFGEPATLQPSVGIEILDAAQLAALDSDLAASVQLPLVKTPAHVLPGAHSKTAAC